MRRSCKMLSKQMKIEDIKKVGDFYQALKSEVLNTFNDYEKCGIFDNWTEEQKKVCYGFGTHILSNAYNPIRNKYVKEERKKYDKILNNCNEFLGEYHGQIRDLQSQLAKKDKVINELNKTLEMCKHIKRYDIGEMFLENAKLIIEKRQFAISELEKVNNILTDTIIDVTQNEFDLNKLCYLEEISKKFQEKIQQQINELEGNKK